jgi:RNA polymerase sigma-70 factor, ECF subfamily
MHEQVNLYIKGCLQKDPRSEEMLYRYCFTNLIKVCMRYHANQDDATASFNKAMHKVFDKLKSYRREGAFLGWVRTIIIKTCLNDLSRVIKYSDREISEADTTIHQTTPEVYANISEKEILALVQQLPATSRTVFNLYVMEGYTHEQIGKELKIATGTSKWQLNQARTSLKDKLSQLSKNEISIHAK